MPAPVLEARLPYQMKLFIAGTDTDVGKTFITASICCSLISSGFRVCLQKWISTGAAGRSPDIEYVKDGIASSLGMDSLNLMEFSSPYCLSFPSSPHLSSEMEGLEIDEEHIIEEAYRCEGLADILIIEGTGGLMVPVTRSLLLLDIVERVKPAVLLVARSGLGTINHTLLSLDALRNRGLEPLAVVLNQVAWGGQRDGSDSRIVMDNLRIVSELGGTDVFGPVPFGVSPFGREMEVKMRPFVARVLDRLKDNSRQMR